MALSQQQNKFFLLVFLAAYSTTTAFAHYASPSLAQQPPGTTYVVGADGQPLPVILGPDGLPLPPPPPGIANTGALYPPGWGGYGSGTKEPPKPPPPPPPFPKPKAGPKKKPKKPPAPGLEEGEVEGDGVGSPGWIKFKCTDGKCEWHNVANERVWDSKKLWVGGGFWRKEVGKAGTALPCVAPL